MEKLGINGLQLIAQIVNFGIIFFILYKFTYKTILKVLGDREKRIRESIENSEKIKKELEQIEETKADELSKARKEADRVVKEAEKIGEDERKRIIEAAKEEASELVKKELKNFEEKQKTLEKEMREQTVELSITITRHLVKEFMDIKDQEKLTDRAIEQLKHLEGKTND